MHLSTPQGHDGALRRSGEVNQIKLQSEHSVQDNFLPMVQVGANSQKHPICQWKQFLNQVCRCTIMYLCATRTDVHLLFLATERFNFLLYGEN